MTKVKKLLLDMKKQPGLDWFFLGLVVILNLIGLVAMGSASYASAYYYRDGNSYYFIQRQAVFLVIGLVGMYFISRIDYHIFKKRIFKSLPFKFNICHLIYIVSFVLLILVPFIGTKDENGIRRALNFGFSVQPSEIFKFTTILILAYHFESNYKTLYTVKHGLIVPILYLVGPLLLIWLQPHASCVLILLMLLVCMMFVSGCLSKRNVLTGFAAVAVVAVAFGKMLIEQVGHFMTRIELWLYGTASSGSADNYQTEQSLYAIGSGGFFGRGLGLSRQKMLFLPEPQNDFVFSIFCEEFGFLGASIVIILFALLVFRGMQIAIKAKDRLGGFLAFGVTMLLALQVILNIAVVTRTIPNTGISLPFFSYGGSALVMFLLEMGVVLSVSRYSRIEKV